MSAVFFIFFGAFQKKTLFFAFFLPCPGALLSRILGCFDLSLREMRGNLTASLTTPGLPGGHERQLMLTDDVHPPSTCPPNGP
jgi:hypothetical protein